VLGNYSTECDAEAVAEESVLWYYLKYYGMYSYSL
jgi:hypothetical protein